MSKNKKSKEINTQDLPQDEVFKKKEVFQHPQPADWGKPMETDKLKKTSSDESGKEENKTSKEMGLNEEASGGDAGAFEGFEDQGK